jgi:hypothetical protein
MQTPLKPARRTTRIRSIKFSLNNLFNYTIYLACSIILGCLLQLIFLMDMNKIGKDSILTGLPVIRKYFFICPMLINIVLLIWIILLFTQQEISESMNGNIWRFFNKTRLAYFITNSAHLSIFYFLYNYLYIPLWINNEFKLSGHVLASFFSGAILSNLQTLCETFINENIKKEFMNYTLITIKFLKYHNIYSIFWTAWMFHKIRETIISFFISFIVVCLVGTLGLDRLIVKLFNAEARRKFGGKEKNKIYENYQILNH